MTKTRGTALALVWLSATAMAEPRWVTRTLPNGLTVVVAPKRGVPLVTARLGFKAGSMVEPPELNGLTHLSEHMWFKANQKLPDQAAFRARAEALGIVANASTTEELVEFHITTTTEHFSGALDLMRDALVTPHIDETELAKERLVVIGELDRRESEPGAWLWRAVVERAYGPLASRQVVIGSRPLLRQATVEQMQYLQRTYYLPGNGFLVVAGDVDPEATFQKVEAAFGPWGAGPNPFSENPVPLPVPMKSSSVVVVERPVATARAYLLWHGPGADGAALDTYAPDVIASVVRDMSSQFKRTLIIGGPCLEADFEYATRRYGGPVTLWLAAAPERLATCVTTALAELEALRTPGVYSDRELKNAMAAIRSQVIKERETATGLATSLTSWWAVAGLPHYESYSAHIDRVTRADITRWLDRYVVGKPFCAGFMVSPEMAKAGGYDEAHFRRVLRLGEGTTP